MRQETYKRGVKDSVKETYSLAREAYIYDKRPIKKRPI